MIGDLFGNWEGLICGVDEAGRGPLAGPVVAAAVILGTEVIPGVRDSKKLSAKRRDELAAIIKQKAIAWSIAEASVEEIDKLNILQATLLAMTRAVDTLKIKPDVVLVDGNRLPQWQYRSDCIVKGDDLIAEISAASILAKTYRDALMKRLARQHPEYGFEKHAGYGTKMHLQALDIYGPCSHHRKTFKPVANAAIKHDGRRK